MLGLLSLVTMLFFSINVYATSVASPIDGPVDPSLVIDPNWVVPDYDGTNGYEAFQVTGMYEFNDPSGSGNATVGDTNILTGSPYEATGRAAFFVGNDMQDDGEPSPSYNIGQAGDGLLNGDDQYWAVKETDPQNYYQFDGYEFISEFQDVDRDGETDDPGWIHLGTQEGPNASFDYASVGSIDIGQLIDIDFVFTLDEDGEMSGASWTLTPMDGILDLIYPLLGVNFFDHLAVVLKSSDYFAIYDLDFNKIFGLDGLSDEYFVPVQLTGTFNNSDLVLGPSGNPQAISHISFWAHDPVPTSVVPEPSTLILLGAGLLGMGLYIHRRKA